MKLPILDARAGAPTHHDLVRLFLRTELHWSEHLGERAALRVGTALVNAAFNGVPEANRVLDAALPAGTTATEALAEVSAHFAAAGATCAKWILNPAAPADATGPLAAELARRGYGAQRVAVMRLGALVGMAPEAPGLKIIPARAGYRQTRQLLEERAAQMPGAEPADAALLHLDDPHFDALLALEDGRAVALAGVLGVGEIGRIEQVFVTADRRRRGIGRTMMRRVLELCARGQLRQVLAGVAAENVGGAALAARLGFVRVGEMAVWGQQDKETEGPGNLCPTVSFPAVRCAIAGPG